MNNICNIKILVSETHSVPTQRSLKDIKQHELSQNYKQSSESDSTLTYSSPTNTNTQDDQRNAALSPPNQP